VNFDPKPYIEGILAANREELAKIAARRERALEEARRIAREIIGHDPSTKRVLLFGSLTGEGPKHLNFDIDIALDEGDPYLAMDITERSEFSVDVVRLDRVPQHVRERIEQTGIVLAERDSA